MSLPRIACRVALIASSSLLAFSVSASAQDCSTGNATYVQLPNGSCMNMDYMTIRGHAEASAEAAEQLYNQALELNVERPGRTYTTYSSTTGETVMYRNQLTPEEKAEREELLNAASEVRAAAEASSGSVDSLTLPLHMQALRRIAGTMAGE